MQAYSATLGATMRSGLLFPILAFAVLSPVLAKAADGPAFANSLPSQVVGVVGSGDQIGLLLRSGSAVRTLKLGDVVQDGWVLTHLNPSSAILSLNGQQVEIGLNPQGEITNTSADLQATQITVVGSAEAEILRRLLDTGKWDGKAMPGLDLQETQRSLIYSDRLNQATAGWVAQYGPAFSPTLEMIRAAVGGPEAWADASSLAQRHQAAYALFSTPFYQAADQSQAQAARAAGLPDGQLLLVDHTGPLDSQGGRMIYPTAQVDKKSTSVPSP